MKKIFLLIFLFLSINVWAEDDERISVLSVADKEKITVGERITCALKIFMTKEIKDVSLDQNSKIDPFVIKDYKIYKDEVLKDGRRLKRVDYILTIYDTGKYVIPGFGVNYELENGKKGVIKAAPIKIEVQSVIKEKIQDIKDVKDIKGAVQINKSYVKRLSFLALVFLIMVLVVIAFYFYYKSKIKVKVQEPVLFEEDAALKELSLLKTKNLLAKGFIKEYFFELSEIAKRYLEKRYAILAVEYTTTEIAQSLKGLKINSDVYNLIKEFLAEADLVKFAKMVPDSSVSEEAYKKVWNIIELTKKQREKNVSV